MIDPAVSPDWDAMLAAATAARERALAPFSRFRVGAALATAAGLIITGCNIENASYGLTVCAERVALWKALSDGHRHFAALLVVADTETLTPPCGACRQLIWEFGGDLPVRLANLHGRQETLRAGTLLPRAFDAGFLRS
ncbi:MAG: cytidine deaminase [Terriglobales bacterium]